MEFVRFFFDEINDAYRGPSPSSAGGLAELSTDTCKSCAAVGADIDGLAKAKQRLASDAFAPLSAMETQAVTKSEIRVSFTMSQLAANVLSAEGAVVDSQTAKSQRQIAVVVWKGDQWRMNGLAGA